MFKVLLILATLTTEKFVRAAFVSPYTANPAGIQIGGLFAPASSVNGYKDLAQAEHLAAFLMAINDINNKTDGLYDDVLPSTSLHFAVRGGSALEEMNINFLDFIYLEEAGVSAIISAQDSRDALLINQLATQLLTPVVLSVANSGIFNNRATYPYVSETVALESYQGLVMKDIVCDYFNARKVVVFTTAEDDSIELHNAFWDANICTLNIMADISIRSMDISLASQIATAKATGARYFVAFLPAMQVAALLEQGFAAGLFHDNTVIITAKSGSENVTQYLMPTTDVETVMAGVFSLEYWPNYYMNITTEAISFAKRWKAQPSRAGRKVGNHWVCDTTTDSTGAFYLYQTIDINNVTHCTGLNFASYKETGLDILPYTALTYDATIMMAMAFDLAVKNNLNYNDPSVIQGLIVYNVSLTGASGPINLAGGVSEYGYSGRGARHTGNEYVITNFNPTAEDFVPIGYFNGDTEMYESCSPVDDIVCFAPVYLVSDGQVSSVPPDDTPPAIINQLSTAYVYVLFVMAGLIAILVIIFFVFTVAYRNTKVIKASQPPLLYCILLGGLVAGARTMLGGLNKTDSVCVGEFWFGHLAFTTMIGSLFVKSYRVHCIVNTKTIRKVTFSAMDAVKMLAGIQLATVIFLSVCIIFGEPHLRNEREISSNQEQVWKSCSMAYPEYQDAAYAMEAVGLAIAFRVCWEIRNVPDIVNESKQISTGTFRTFYHRLHVLIDVCVCV
jgi:hypothetical protein